MNIHPAIIALGFLAMVFGGGAIVTGLLQSVFPF